MPHYVGIREYIASPALASFLEGSTYNRRLAELRQRRRAVLQLGENISWWDLRLYKLPDSVVSGAITGSILNSWKRTSFCVSFFRVFIRLIFDSSGGRAGIVPGVTTGGFVCAVLQMLYNEAEVARVKYIIRNLPSAPVSGVSPPQSPAQPSKPLSERILNALGFEKISDEVYLERLKRTRDESLRRIAELEGELEEERRREGP